MEQQVGPLGKPMSTAIKRSAQVNERWGFFLLFFFVTCKENGKCTGLSGCFVRIEGALSPDGKGWKLNSLCSWDFIISLGK